MKIFIEANSIATERRSGIGHATLEIVRSIQGQLKDTNHEVVLLVPFGKKGLLDQYNLEGLSIRSLPPGHRYVNYVLTRTSLPIPVDLLYGRGVYIFPNYKTWFVPFSTSLTFVHDVAYKIYPDTIHPANLTYLHTNMPRWLKRATRIIAISNTSKDEIIQYFPEVKDKISVIYLGVDDSVYFRRSIVEIVEIRDKYGIDEDYFLYVGNIEPRKNILTLLSAYKEYIDSFNTSTQLVLIGASGWNNDEINHRITTLQKEGYNIHRPSQYVEDSDLPALYSGSRALVHVSLHEGFGLSLLQAQACGASVVASDLPVFREVLQPEGVLFVPPLESSKVADAMSMVPLRDKQITRRKRAVYTWSTTAAQLIAVTGIMDNTNE